MRKSLNILAIVLVAGIYSCKKEVDVNATDHGKSYIKMYGTLSEGADMVETDDGGFFLLGTTQGALNKDLLLVKTDKFGNTQWSRSFAGPSSGSENIASAIELLRDGGAAILATTTVTDTSDNEIKSTYLLIVDEMGFKRADAYWNSGVVEPVPEDEIAYGMTVSTEGEEKLYFVSDRTLTNGRVVSIVRRWTVSTGETTEYLADHGVDIGLRDITFSAENDIRACGYVNITGDSTGYDFFYIGFQEDDLNHLDPINPSFNQTAGNDVANCISQASDGDQLICGSTTFSDDTKEFVAAKVSGLDDGGDPQVEWIFNGTSIGLGNSESYSITELSDGFVIAGYTEGLDRQMHIVKLNAAGTSVVWQRDYGFTSFDEAKKVVEATDGGLMVFGTSSDERGNTVMTLLKLDSKGNLLQ